MLRIKDLVVNYGRISALKNISLNVHEKEIVALIGANGAGKSTTLLSISGLVERESGHIYFGNEDISDVKPSSIVNYGISHVPEGRHIFARMTVEENLITGTFANKKISRTQIKSRLNDMYDLFPRLGERNKQLGGTLSGGEQQMLAIARSLMINPKLIMLDEPSLGLAPIIVQEIFELIKKINEEGTTVLLIEQNASMALSIAHRGYVLENGNIVLTGTGKELLENEDVKKAYLGI
jgi:branched-chain amino acid transport system ATP-binding protein